jgi:hypothetical protein
MNCKYIGTIERYTEHECEEKRDHERNSSENAYKEKIHECM